jgi:hypothetical protein
MQREVYTTESDVEEYPVREELGYGKFKRGMRHTEGCRTRGAEWEASFVCRRECYGTKWCSS